MQFRHLYSPDPKDFHKLAYVYVEESIRQEIESFTWKSGDKIPSEPTLAEKYKVSIGTIKKAMQNLVHSGFLYRIQGKGTYVAGSFARDQNLLFYKSYKDFGLEEVDKEYFFVSCQQVKCAKKIATYLQLAEKTPVFILERIIKSEGNPYILVRSHFEASRFSGLDAINPERYSQQALTYILDNEFGMPAMRAEELISINYADSHVAQLLEIQEKTPTLYIEMISCTYNKMPFEYRESFCVQGNKIFRKF